MPGSSGRRLGTNQIQNASKEKFVKSEVVTSNGQSLDVASSGSCCHPVFLWEFPAEADALFKLSCNPVVTGPKEKSLAARWREVGDFGNVELQPRFWTAEKKNLMPKKNRM